MNYLSIAVLFCCLAAGSISPAPAYADKAPTEVGGFKLGSSIEEYDFISYRNFLKEVVIDQIPGFRKGTISYGVCDRPGEIVKIKLKYMDPSKGMIAPKNLGDTSFQQRLHLILITDVLLAALHFSPQIRLGVEPEAILF